MDEIAPPIVAPALPTSSAEANTLMTHYYRAEMTRMNAWRARLDLTSNWSITVVAALLSVSLSTPSAHHGLALFGMVIILLLLVVEARRYRFYDVYRMRIRQFERHYFGQFFQADPKGGPEPWLVMLAQDLRHPQFRISMMLALRRRRRRSPRLECSTPYKSFVSGTPVALIDQISVWTIARRAHRKLARIPYEGMGLRGQSSEATAVWTTCEDGRLGHLTSQVGVRIPGTRSNRRLSAHGPKPSFHAAYYANPTMDGLTAGVVSNADIYVIHAT